MRAGEIEVRMDRATDMPGLEAAWRDLQYRADASMFLSWSWIGCWLASLPASIEVGVVRAVHQGREVGLALLVVSPRRRLRLPLGKVANLHSTGRASYDGLAIEHNGFLLDRAHARATQAAMLAYLCNPRRPWGSVQLSGLSNGQAIGAEALPPRVFMESHERMCALVGLQQVRDRDGDYLGLLSPRRRAHIRRSMRACEEWGLLTLEQAVDAATAAEYLERLLELHRLRRTNLGRDSAFDTPFSRDFHGRFVAQGLARGEVQFLRVRAGEHDVGYLYNFVHRGRVSFYQSGFDFSRIDHKFSPGLVTLAMAIEHNAHLGHDVFDFLAGDAAYKRTLATHSEPMWWIELRRDGMVMRAEGALRRAARSWREWRARRHVGPADRWSIMLLMSLEPWACAIPPI